MFDAANSGRSNEKGILLFANCSLIQFCPFHPNNVTGEKFLDNLLKQNSLLHLANTLR